MLTTTNSTCRKANIYGSKQKTTKLWCVHFKGNLELPGMCNF